MIRKLGQAAAFLWQFFWPLGLYDLITYMVFRTAGDRLGPVGAMGVSSVIAVFLLELVRRYRVSCFGSCTKKRWGGRKQWTGRIFRLLALSAILSVGLNIILIYSGIPAQDQAFQESNQTLFGAPMPVQLLVITVLAPLVEEMIFRGLAYERLRRPLPMWAAVPLSALFFGVSHGNLSQGIYAALLGVCLAVVYEKDGGLLGSWIFHLGANLAALALSML